jgi:hypothetical protein
MTKALLAVAVCAFALGGVGVPRAHAANADNPYGNVDHRNDAGNDTGDSRVEGLNDKQLNRNYQGPVESRQPAPGTVTTAQPNVVVVPAPPR